MQRDYKSGTHPFNHTGNDNQETKKNVYLTKERVIDTSLSISHLQQSQSQSQLSQSPRSLHLHSHLQSEQPQQSEQMQPHTQIESDSSVVDVDANMTQESKQRRRKRLLRGRNRSIPQVFDPIILDTVSLNEVGELVLLYTSRRFRIQTPKQTFMYEVRQALMDKKYLCRENEFEDVQEESLKFYKKQQNIHNGRAKILVDVTYLCKSANSYKKMINVDILGIRKKDGTPIIFEDIECMLKCEKIINIFKGTHWSCINARCDITFEKDTIVKDNPIICPECKTEQCPGCQTAWMVHKGITCEQFKIKKNLESLKDKEIVSLLESGSMQLCPTCKNPVIRIDGCNHITCVSECKDHWCWACGMDKLHLRYKDVYHHYSEYINGHKNEKRCIAIHAFSSPDEAARMISERNKRLYPYLFNRTEEKKSEDEPPKAANIVHRQNEQIPEEQIPVLNPWDHPDLIEQLHIGLDENVHAEARDHN